jgi:hypothetical protein
LDEVTIFPNGRHDDQVDGLSGAFNGLVSRGGIRGDMSSISEAFGEKYDTPEGGWEGDIPHM